jgi:hypothetical protein
MTKIELYEDDNHRATLSLDEESTVWEVAEQLTLLVQIMGFTHNQARQILPTEEDWNKFGDEVREA